MCVESRPVGGTQQAPPAKLQEGAETKPNTLHKEREQHWLVFITWRSCPKARHTWHFMLDHCTNLENLQKGHQDLRKICVFRQHLLSPDFNFKSVLTFELFPTWNVQILLDVIKFTSAWIFICNAPSSSSIVYLLWCGKYVYLFPQNMPILSPKKSVHHFSGTPVSCFLNVPGNACDTVKCHINFSFQNLSK